MTVPPKCDVWGCGHHYEIHSYQSNTGCLGPCQGVVRDRKGNESPCDCRRYRGPGSPQDES